MYYFGHSDAAEQGVYIIDILSPFKVVVANALANNCLFIQPADTKKKKSINLESCFWSLDKCKTNIHSPFSSALFFPADFVCWPFGAEQVAYSGFIRDLLPLCLEMMMVRVNQNSKAVGHKNQK